MTKTTRLVNRLIQQIHRESPFPQAYVDETARRVLTRELHKILKEKK